MAGKPFDHTRRPADTRYFRSTTHAEERVEERFPQLKYKDRQSKQRLLVWAAHHSKLVYRFPHTGDEVRQSFVKIEGVTHELFLAIKPDNAIATVLDRTNLEGQLWWHTAVGRLVA